MVLRSWDLPCSKAWGAIRSRRCACFHTYTALRASSAVDHYETLGLSSSASAGDIKSKFYALSKTHHPDRNPDNPSASEKFVKISEAYAILGNSHKRQRYDHEHFGSRSRPSRPGQSTQNEGPAGGRPASGLSRRRTHFRGPPPSFYRSGGWGDHREKRQSQANASAERPDSGAYTGGGFNPGEAARGQDDDFPYWDKQGHFRTQSEQDRRRQRRSSESFVPEEPTGSIVSKFFFVSGIITFAVALNSFVANSESKTTSRYR